MQERYKSFNLINNGKEIRFVIKMKDKTDINILEKQLNIMMREIYEICGVRMRGIVSRSEMVSEMIGRSLQLSEVS